MIKINHKRELIFAPTEFMDDHDPLIAEAKALLLVAFIAVEMSLKFVICESITTH